MKNIGRCVIYLGYNFIMFLTQNFNRDTQTSAGPNSFGKTRQGFCDSKKVFERQMKKVIEEADD